MVKSTVQESLDEAFEQRLTILDEPWNADYRFAERRLSRRDQHSLRHGQRRPSSEVRNHIKQRKPLPDMEERGIPGASVTSPIRLEREAYTSKEWKQPNFLNDASSSDSVGTGVQSSSDQSTCREDGRCCGLFLPRDQSCPQNDFAWTSTAGNAPTPRHSEKRHDDVIEVMKMGLKHPENKGSSTECMQNHKRKLLNSAKIVTQAKRFRNIGCNGNDVTNGNKSGFKCRNEHGAEANFEAKRYHEQVGEANFKSKRRHEQVGEANFKSKRQYEQVGEANFKSKRQHEQVGESNFKSKHQHEQGEEAHFKSKRQHEQVGESNFKYKHQHEQGEEAHFSSKRERPQLWPRQPETDEFEDMADEIHVVVDSRAAMLSSLQEPHAHSHQFKRTLVNSARVRH